MPVKEPPFTIGIEEEYQLVDRQSRDLVTTRPDNFLADCESQLGNQVTTEFLISQIEVGTKVCGSVIEAGEGLKHLRKTVAGVAETHGLAIIAASTHPFANWDRQIHTDKERYHILARDLQGVARRLMICGMHVHVGIDDDALRIDLMNQVCYFLPHFLALSTSSPFWQGDDTGLKSYRISVFDELPRTGLPERFESYGEYERHVSVLVDAGVIEDATKLWWDIRPSARFQTLEMRIVDVCTYVEDAMTVAAFYVCVLRMLYRLRRDNKRWRTYSSMLISENRWRAQRYGIDEGLVDFGRGEVVPYPELLDEIIELVREDAQHFDCQAQIEHARTILKRGTSAHRQTATYHEATEAGAEDMEALRAVVDQLIEETLENC